MLGLFLWSDMKTKIMAVMNLTPDSFSDGGRLSGGLDAVLVAAEQHIQEGADWLDLGGESTRPGAEVVSEAEEMDRVLPVLEAIKARFEVPCSLDTSTPELMRQGAALGADMINDVRALSRPGALQAAAQTGLPVVLMHMQGTPDTMQLNPSYADVVGEVEAFLIDRVQACQQAGIAKDRIVLDPGFGFGKTLDHNVALFQALPSLCQNWPVLVGVSRKRMIGDLTGQAVEHRDIGSAVAAGLAAQQGAAWVRVHNVAATRDAMAVMNGLNKR